MADAILKLKLNPRTGERTLIVEYHSEADSMPFEHEEDHRLFVERVLGKPISAVAEHLVIRVVPPLDHKEHSGGEQTLQQSQAGERLTACDEAESDDASVSVPS